MSLKKSKNPGCCGTFNITYEISTPLRIDYISKFEDSGFKVSLNYKNAGMLYAENEKLIVLGSFGTKNLKLKCKVAKCEQFAGPLEDLLSSLA